MNPSLARRSRSLLIALLFALGPIVTSGQMPGPPAGAVREMAKLQFLTGIWEGQGSVEFGPGQKQTFTSREEVLLKLDGVALQIEGTHHTRFPGSPGEVKVHHALALVTYDEKAGDYQFRALKFDNQSVDARAKLQNGAFVWGFTDPRLGQVRFTIRVSADGKWQEIGERSTDGQRWTNYFEMNLTRKK